MKLTKREINRRAKIKQIMDGAATVFARDGWNGSTRDVQEEAKVTQGMMYHYFPTKEDLGKAVVDLGFTAAEGADDDGPRLQAIIDAGMVLAYRTPREPMIMAAARLATEQGTPFFGDLWRNWIPLLTQLFEQADQRGELVPGVQYEDTAATWVSAFTGFDHMLRPDPPGVLEEQIAKMFRVLVRGVANEETIRILDIRSDRGVRLMAAAAQNVENVEING